MSRDSLFGETILWAGRARSPRVPRRYQVASVAAALLAVVALLFAVLVGTSLHARVGSLLAFAAWCTTLSLAAWRLPLLWADGVEYMITERHVIWRRGRIRRSIERSAISYAMIQWHPTEPDVGDLVLVRAVPTGALRRTLRLTLVGVTGPDRLWAIVRGLTPPAPLGLRERPLAQRLDPGERVLWSGTPLASPWSARRAATAVGALLLGVAAVRMMLRAVPSLARVLRLHALEPVSAAILVAAVALAATLLLSVTLGVAYAAYVRPGVLARRTRYFVTNQRVLICRGDDELHLDRANIAYVIAAPGAWSLLKRPLVKRLHDVFLVLDGPQARGLASSGAFAASRDLEQLRPVFASIDDAETVGALLGDETASLQRAA